MRRNIDKFKSNLTTVLDELKTKDRLKKTEKDLMDYAQRYVEDDSSLNKDEVKLLVTLYDVYKGEKKLEHQKKMANDLEYQEKQKARKRNQRRNYIVGSVFRNFLEPNSFVKILSYAACCGYISDRDLAIFGLKKEIDFTNKKVVLSRIESGEEYFTVDEERVDKLMNTHFETKIDQPAKQKFYQQFEQSGDK